MSKLSTKRGVVNPALIVVGGIILVVIAISVASGALKFEGSVSKKSGEPTSSQPAASLSTKTYQNQAHGLTLEYPQGWSIKENPAANVIVAFGSPKESSNDKFVDNVNVSFTDLSTKPDATLNEISDLWQKQTESDLPAGAFSLSQIKPATVAGQEAKRMVYEYSLQGQDMKGFVVITLKNNKAYIVTYTAEKASYGKFENAANTIVSSLQVN